MQTLSPVQPKHQSRLPQQPIPRSIHDESPTEKRSTAPQLSRAKPRGTKGNTLDPAKRPKARLGNEGGSGNVRRVRRNTIPPTHQCDLPARSSQVARTKSEKRPAQSPTDAPSGRSSGLGRTGNHPIGMLPSHRLLTGSGCGTWSRRHAFRPSQRRVRSGISPPSLVANRPRSRQARTPPKGEANSSHRIANCNKEVCAASRVLTRETWISTPIAPPASSWGPGPESYPVAG
jgi:hypothetical protein